MSKPRMWVAAVLLDVVLAAGFAVWGLWPLTVAALLLAGWDVARRLSRRDDSHARR